MMLVTTYQKLLTTLFALLLLGACATTGTSDRRERVEASGVDESDDTYTLSSRLKPIELAEVDPEDLTADEQIYWSSRSELTDRFAHLTHEMPSGFMQTIQEEVVDINQGFRVQIYTTRNVDMADSTLAAYESWAFENFDEYVPRGYVHYRQPYYRVRVGDFHNRDHALDLSRTLKSRYPSAWIIYDRINPERVPADTVQIRFSDDL